MISQTIRALAVPQAEFDEAVSLLAEDRDQGRLTKHAKALDVFYKELLARANITDSEE